MIWNDDILFIHVPKTGGMMMTEILLEKLPRPLYYTLPEGHYKHPYTDIEVLKGKRHEYLDEAVEMLKEHGKTLADFKYILTVIRNPYDLVVSRFAYLQKGYKHDGGKTQQLAMSGDFEEFARGSEYRGKNDPEIFRYYTLDGEMPPNMVILKYENLQEEFRAFLKKFDIEVERMPMINKSHHGHYTEYMNEAVEQIIYDKHVWMFENGFYRRWTPEKKVPGWRRLLYRLGLRT